MRRPLVLLGFGGVALLAQSVVALHARQGLVPDLGFLVVVAAGLHLPSLGGPAVSATLGYAADLLSGALLGQHALLRTLAWAVTRLSNRRLDLRRPLPLAVFVAGLTVVDIAGLAGLTWLFAGRSILDSSLVPVLAMQAAVNAAVAPLVLAASRGLLALAAADEARRSVRFEPQRPPGAVARRRA